jgi:predicted kinase
MPKVHLIEGPVGAGKSTYAESLALRTGGVHIALDEWFARLYSPDRPVGDFVAWYVERKERLLELVWTHAQRILTCGNAAILELGLIQRESRVAFCRNVLDVCAQLQVHIVDAPRELRRERVRRRNTEQGSTFSMVVPDPVFEVASNLWEAPDEDECSEFAVEFVPASPDGDFSPWAR